MKIDKLITGQSEEHLEEFRGVLLHSDIIESLRHLYQDAKRSGFELAIASGFRSFDRQLNIWNNKATGKRTVLDSNEKEIDPLSLSPKERLFTILRWSALPGASRHHWGTDLDIYDLNALPSEDYQLQLTRKESLDIFESFHTWLDSNLEKYDFFRPYHSDHGGVAPEPWHISYRPLAENISDILSPELIAELLESKSIELKKAIFENLDEIFDRFIEISE